MFKEKDDLSNSSKNRSNKGTAKFMKLSSLRKESDTSAISNCLLLYFNRTEIEKQSNISILLRIIAKSKNPQVQEDLAALLQVENMELLQNNIFKRKNTLMPKRNEVINKSKILRYSTRAMDSKSNLNNKEIRRKPEIKQSTNISFNIGIFRVLFWYLWLSWYISII